MHESHPDGTITTEVRGRVLLMGLDRTAKLNGVTPKMVEELAAACGRLEADDELWVGVLFAHGAHFTAGLDLPKFADQMKSGEKRFERHGVDIFGLTRPLPKPIVCAVQGITFTAGLELMLACDIVVAASDCRFSQLEPRRGIHATGGATVRFVDRGGYGNAMYHLLTADEFDAREAYRIGLVQEVVEPGRQLGRAVEIAERIARMAPLAVRETKASALRYLREGEKAAFEALIPTQQRLASSVDGAEGVASFREKREPVFTGR
ncbi:MAG: crotonase/enoyl-CoA hydratase family protein [Gammaproteobacteria bacterium]